MTTAVPGTPQPNKLRLYKWIVFSLVISVIPFLARAICLGYLAKPITLDVLLSNGDLFLVVCAIAAEAIGDVFGIRTRPLADIRWLLIIGYCFIIAILSGILYGIAGFKMIALTATPVNDDVVVFMSLTMFVTTATAVGYVKLLIPE